MRHLTLEEVSETTRINVTSLRRMAREGRLPALKVGKRFLVREDEFKAWLESKRVKPEVKR